MGNKRWSVILLLTAAAAAQKKPVTLADIGAARPAFEAAVWSPDGKRLAYERNGELWVYEIGRGARRSVISLKSLETKAVPFVKPLEYDWQNRRVREARLQWSPPGDGMLVAAGGDLFWVRLADGAAEPLTASPEEERDPKLSPDGGAVAFRRGPDLYVLEIASRKVTRLTADGSATLRNGQPDWVYPEEFNLGTAFWWSPDSRQIAYLQFDLSPTPLFPQVDWLELRARFEPQRYPKAGQPNADVRVGVTPRYGGPTRWIDTGDPRDRLLARADWMPDSRRLALQRLNRVQNRLDLLEADAGTGETSLLLAEQDPYWINVGDDRYFFQRGGRFLWGSERDGFRHLYLYERKGSGWKTKQLTRGSWEVTELAGVDEERGWIYYLATEASPLERHLYRVRTEGGAPERLTRTPGTHAISLAPDHLHYLDTFSSVTSPPRRTLHEASGREIGVYDEGNRAAADEFDILPTEFVSLKTSDGVLLYGRLLKPARFDLKKKYPAVVQIYGGPHGQAVKNAWAGLSWEQAMAHRGFVIWQLDNRGTNGRGHAFETPVFRNLGAQELRDQLEGLRYLRSLGYIDMDRVGLTGWSYGGYLTLYSLVNAPDSFRAGIAGAPVTDWRNYDTIYTERYMGLPEENRAGYEASSPLGKAANLKARLLILHNLGDDNVHFQHALQMADALQQAGKLFTMMIYPQKTHHVSGPAQKQMHELMARFFEEHLR